MKQKFFTIPLSQIQSVVVEQQKLSASQKRGGFFGSYAAPSLAFFAEDNIYVSYLDSSDLLHKIHFATKYDDGASLKLEIEDRISRSSGLNSSPLDIARGNLIYVLLQSAVNSKLRPLNSYYRFNMPWGAKILLALSIAIILGIYFVYALPK